MHHNAADITGQRFGLLTAIEQTSERDAQARIFWRCHCDCGQKKLVRTAHLRSGRVRSCGCDRYNHAPIKHGHPRDGLRSSIYSSWASLVQRCTNPNNQDWPRYGGRGITFCDKWKTFGGFAEDMASSWAPGLTIDRINNDGNYEPANCRWATRQQQSANRGGKRKPRVRPC